MAGCFEINGGRMEVEKNKNPAENFSGYVEEARELLRRHYTG